MTTSASSTIPSPTSSSTSKTTSNEAREALKDQVDTVRSDLRELARLSKRAFGEIAEASRDRSRQMMHEGHDLLEEYEERFSDTVRRNPGRSTLIALGVGTLLGMIWSRK